MDVIGLSGSKPGNGFIIGGAIPCHRESTDLMIDRFPLKAEH
jgi:hypothetical protein